MAITHLLARDGDTATVLGEALTFKARHSTCSVIESSALPGQGLPPHVHYDQSEMIFVIAGQYQLFSGEDRMTLTPRSFAFVPRGTVHSLTVSGSERAHCLQIYDPPGVMEKFLDEVRVAGTHADDDDHQQTVFAIARRLGLGLLTHPV